MALETINIQMVLIIQASGSKISNMVWDGRYGLMGPSSKVIITTDLSMVMDCLVGQTAVGTLEGSLITTLKDAANMTGQTAVVILVDGMITKCMVTETSFGLMADNTQEPIAMIQKWDLVYLDGLMVDDMKATGKKENSMEKENLYQIMEKNDKGSGNLEKEYIGLIINYTEVRVFLMNFPSYQMPVNDLLGPVNDPIPF